MMHNEARFTSKIKHFHFVAEHDNKWYVVVNCTNIMQYSAEPYLIKAIK